MAIKNLIIAPTKQNLAKAVEVNSINQAIHDLIIDLIDTARAYSAVGIAAPMIGVYQRVIIVDISTKSNGHIMINPRIINSSSTSELVLEGSICFPAIEAQIKRPRQITVEYLDQDNNIQRLEAFDLLAACIQHEIDYLNGIVFLDHLSKLRRDILIKKMSKYLNSNKHHIHTQHCNH